MTEPTTTTPDTGSAATGPRALRKTRVGVVTSNKMDKTIVVEVVRRVPHPKFGKIVKRTMKLYAHDEDRVAKAGDKVRVVETRPLSKLKRWRLVEILAH
jgi:small subunit ribosomal protein S17